MRQVTQIRSTKSHGWPNLRCSEQMHNLFVVREDFALEGCLYSPTRGHGWQATTECKSSQPILTTIIVLCFNTAKRIQFPKPIHTLIKGNGKEILEFWIDTPHSIRSLHYYLGALTFFEVAPREWFQNKRSINAYTLNNIILIFFRYALDEHPLSMLQFDGERRSGGDERETPLI